jgi:hypothetical protein
MKPTRYQLWRRTDTEAPRLTRISFWRTWLFRVLAGAGSLGIAAVGADDTVGPTTPSPAPGKKIDSAFWLWWDRCGALCGLIVSVLSGCLSLHPNKLQTSACFLRRLQRWAA